MTRRLYQAPFSRTDTADFLVREVIGAVPGPDFRHIFYLCPSPRKLRDVQWRFAHQVNAEAFLPPRFFTLGEFSRNLHNEFGSSRRLSPELSTLLVQMIFRQKNSAAGSSSPPLGYCRAVANFIRDLKRAAAVRELGKTRQLIAKLLDAYEKPRARALEALDILEAYDEALKKRGWSDDEDIMTSATGWVTSYPEIPLLVLDSFVAPTRLEQELIAALLSRAQKTFALCYAGPGDEAAYRLGLNFVHFLKSQDFSVVQLEPSPNPPQLSPLRFNSAEDEIAGIARDIKLRNLDGQLKLTDTIVALPALEAYAPLVSRIFREYGIPATVYPNQKLAASPPAVAALSLLAALESGYERTVTTAAFSSEFLPRLLRLSSDTDDKSRNAAAVALNQAARKAGIIRGADAWSHLAQRLEPEEGFKSEVASSFAKDLERRVKQAINLGQTIMDGARTLGEYALRFKKLLGAADFCDNLDPAEPVSDQLLKARGQLYDLLDSLVAFEADFGPQPTDLTGFYQAFSYLLNNVSAHTPDLSPQGVLILSLSETLGLNPDHLYLATLTESGLPGRYPVDPLLPDFVRRELGMPDMDWHLDHERFHFERTCHSSRTAPWLSYHSGAEGKLVLPTPFIEQEPVQAKPAPGLFSPAEEQRYEGSESGKGLSETVQPVDFSADKEVLAILESRFGPNRHLSVTKLEKYRACPYRFYVYEILGLEPVELPKLSLEPQQWGRVVHRALAELYGNGPVSLDQLRSRTLTSLNKVIGEFELDQFWTEVTRRLFENSIDDIIKCEAELRAEGFEPAGVEVTLCGEAGPRALVKGRLDRYDSDGARLRVLDYKTGTSKLPDAKGVTEKKTYLQLPIYCHLLLADHKDKTIANMGIYSTTEAKVNWLVKKGDSVDELIKAALANAIEIIHLIRVGSFSAQPADTKEGCKNCPQAFLCGKPVRKRKRD